MAEAEVEKMDLKFEFKRQVAHMLLGVAVIFLYIFTSLSPWFLMGLALVCEAFFIFNLYLKLPFVNWLVKSFEREHIKLNFPGRGFFSFLIGCSIVLLAFERDIAIAAILVLTFGDAFSTLIGKSMGIIKHPPWLNKHKTLEGSLAGWLVAFNICLFLLEPLEALVAASFGMLIEIIDIRFRWAVIEDNISIPLISALAVYALRLLI